MLRKKDVIAQNFSFFCLKVKKTLKKFTWPN